MDDLEKRVEKLEKKLSPEVIADKGCFNWWVFGGIALVVVLCSIFVACVRYIDRGDSWIEAFGMGVLILVMGICVAMLGGVVFSKN